MALLLILASIPWANAEPSSPALSRSIPAQPLAAALKELMRVTDLQVVWVDSDAAHKMSSEVPAGLSPTQALARLLTGTGLDFRRTGEHSVTVFVGPGQANAARPHELPVPSQPMNEVVVTANRRVEEAQEVPSSIAVWTREDINELGAKDFQDIAARTPGVEYDFYPDLGPQTHTNIAIRGVDARDGTATAIFLDNVPLRADPAGNIGRAIPLLADLERVEILRGPQSTLLGEGAEGGAVRFVTGIPSLTRSTGYIRSEVSTTADGGPSFQALGAFGAPIVHEHLAFRLSAGYAADGGYIDRVDPFTYAVVDRNVNRTSAESARLAVLWSPIQGVRITPSFTYQNVHLHDSPAYYVALSDPTEGLLRSGKLLQQPYSDGFTVGSLNATFELGQLELASLTSHFHRSVFAVTDETNNGVNWGSPLGPEYPVSDQTFLWSASIVRQSEWVEELQLATTDQSARFNWLIGATGIRATYWDEGINLPFTIAGGVHIDGSDLASQGHETQVALFGELVWRFSQQLSARIGERFSHASYEGQAPSAPGIGPYVSLHGSESPTAPRASLLYTPRTDVLYYATVSTGYRLGGLNPPIQPWCPGAFPQAFGPDEVVNYELGAKSRFLDGTTSIEASVFHMSWQHMQNDLNEPGCFTYITNVGTAASDGFDFAGETLLGRALRLGLEAGYTHARYTETIADVTGIRARAGDTLGSIPVVPSPWNVHAYSEYSFAVGQGCRALLAWEDIFHSRNTGPFYSLDPSSPSYDPGKYPDPSNNLMNVRASLRWPSLELGLFVNNVLDSQPTLLRRNMFAGSTFFVATTFRPRTVGTALTWEF